MVGQIVPLAGPWEATKAGIYAGAVCVAQRHPQSGSEWEANARLIAAAPALLAALEYIAGFSDVAIAANPTPIRKRAQAAIAKAKGGA